MAIVFVSPKKTQRTLFITSWSLFILALLSISVILILPEIRNQLNVTPTKGDFTMPDIKINFDVVDSDRVKNLEPFSNIQTQFDYVATDQAGSQTQGVISAISKDEAKSILADRGLQAVSLQEVGLGRSDPFVSYYSPIILKNQQK